MTELPRRSYPLVVPPPGGFEDAVHRGRKIRRRRTSGGTGAAMVVAAALTWTFVGHGGGTSSLKTTHQPPAPSVRAAEASAHPSPTATPSAPAASTGTTLGNGGTGPGHYASSPLPSTGGVPTVPSTGAGPQYAKRGVITPSAPYPDTQPDCLSSTADWCPYATATPNGDGTYTFVYALCRNVNSGSGHLTFDRTQQADFAAVDTDHNDTVWTYSAGQPVVRADTDVPITGGYCMSWTVVWDGYDDFSHTPPAGGYELKARSLAVGISAVKTATFQHD